jgi:hypothetical protein
VLDGGRSLLDVGGARAPSARGPAAARSEAVLAEDPGRAPGGGELERLAYGDVLAGPARYGTPRREGDLKLI